MCVGYSDQALSVTVYRAWDAVGPTYEARNVQHALQDAHVCHTVCLGVFPQPVPACAPPPKQHSAGGTAAAHTARQAEELSINDLYNATQCISSNQTDIVQLI
jgi:hypothetical protein